MVVGLQPPNASTLIVVGEGGNVDVLSVTGIDQGNPFVQRLARPILEHRVGAEPPHFLRIKFHWPMVAGSATNISIYFETEADVSHGLGMDQ